MGTVLVKGLAVDPVAGLVFGKKGKPFVKLNNYGYVMPLTSPGKRAFLAHRLVWEAVHGPIPKGMELNHINGVKTDNRIANLELVTPSENALHAYRLGLRRADGEHNGRAKLTRTDADAIRASTDPTSVVAAHFNVSSTTVRAIRRGKHWSAA